MSNAMRDRMAAAKSGAGASVKAKSAKAPLVESTVELRLVDDPSPTATVTSLDRSAASEADLAVAHAVDVVADSTGADIAPVEEAVAEPDDAPIVLPRIDRHDEEASQPVAAPAEPAASSPASVAASPGLATATAPRRKPARAEQVLEQVTAPPAAMGTAGESRILGVPMSEDAYRMLQQLDRDLALSRRRPVNRVRLITLALEQVLADPNKYADRYLEQHNAGVTWKRRLQARVPVELADQLPLLRYTGEHRQSAGMMVSIAVADLLQGVRDIVDPV